MIARVALSLHLVVRGDPKTMHLMYVISVYRLFPQQKESQKQISYNYKGLRSESAMCIAINQSIWYLSVSNYFPGDNWKFT